MQFMLGLHKMICKYCGNWIPPQHAGCFVCGKERESQFHTGFFFAITGLLTGALSFILLSSSHGKPSTWCINLFLHTKHGSCLLYLNSTIAIKDCNCKAIFLPTTSTSLTTIARHNSMS